VGDFVYHCHILDHEDAGMMAKIRVLPRRGADRRAQNGRTIMKSASASATASR
jgi:hypothetical protein